MIFQLFKWREIYIKSSYSLESWKRYQGYKPLQMECKGSYFICLGLVKNDTLFLWSCHTILFSMISVTGAKEHPHWKQDHSRVVTAGAGVVTRSAGVVVTTGDTVVV